MDADGAMTCLIIKKVMSDLFIVRGDFRIDMVFSGILFLFVSCSQVTAEAGFADAAFDSDLLLMHLKAHISF